MPRTDISTKTTVRSLQVALAAEGLDVPYIAARRIWEATTTSDAHTTTHPGAESPWTCWESTVNDPLSWNPDRHGSLLVLGSSWTRRRNWAQLISLEARYDGEVINQYLDVHDDDGVQSWWDWKGTMSRHRQAVASGVLPEERRVIVLGGELTDLLKTPEGQDVYRDVVELMTEGAASRTYIVASDAAKHDALDQRLLERCSKIVIGDNDPSGYGHHLDADARARLSLPECADRRGVHPGVVYLSLQD